MVKLRTVVIMVVFVGVLVIGGMALFIGKDDRTKAAPSNGDRVVSVVKPERGIGVTKAVVQKDLSLRASIQERELLSFTDSNGVNTYISKKYEGSSPLVELLFKTRDEEGKLQPLWIRHLYLQTHDSGCNYGVRGNGFRIEIRKEKEKHEDYYIPLLLDREYTGIAHFEGAYDPVQMVPGKSGEVKFRTPASLGPGEIYRMEVVFVDKMWERELLQLRKAAEEQLERIKEEEAITVRVTDCPAWAELGLLSGIYSYGKTIREFHDYKSPGLMEVKGPNRLGGELVVYGRKTGGASRMWAYISEVSLRDVNLPEDGEFIAEEEDLVECYLAVAKEDWELVVANWEGVVFCFDSDSKVPLFFTRTDRNVTETDEEIRLAVKVMPWEYHVRGFLKGKSDLNSAYVPLGTLDISEEEGKVYSVKLPSEK